MIKVTVLYSVIACSLIIINVMKELPASSAGYNTIDST